LTPPSDAAALADALSTLLDKVPLRRRLGTAARAVVMERYGMDRVVREYMNLYARLMEDVV
jgi:glycosyltransferase involved in cell wall biosynthesis